MKSKNLMLGLLFGVMSGAAMADDSAHYYAGAGYTKASTEVPPISFSNNLLTGLVGYQFSPYVAVEGRAAVSMGSDSYSSTLGKLEFDVTSQWQLLVKASLPITDAVSLYALAGGMTERYEVKGKSATESLDAQHSESGFTYGAGLSCQISQAVALWLEYQQRPKIGDKTFNDPSSISVGVNLAF